jgi:caffeoyl-CoA O-methyltransferase
MTQPISVLIDQLDALGKTRADALQITREQGDVLHQIALSSNARVIVEVGTSYGFSGLFFGSALLRTGGLMHTIDRNPAKVESSRQTFTDAGLGSIITNHSGEAAEELTKLNGPIDLVFIDADKPSTKAYFELIWPKVRIGGSVLVDNTTTHPAELADYIAFARALPDSVSIELAIGNGMEWTIKVASK